ncbi:MAG TPA: hypothetical protein VH639_10225 [Bryobacteraceae bacterium]|jgi:hypothetical protein
MHRISKTVVLSLALAIAFPVPGTKAKTNPKKAQVAAGPPVLWREPADIATRNLYYGPGGKAHEPHGPFTFEKEDANGTNPKFDVVDADGVKWRVKLGDEARPETAASRLIWAAGYFANEDYFVPVLRVRNLPRLHRGRQFVLPDGTVRNARLKRHSKGEAKLGIWKWDDNPFKDTREWYGLRVMMAVISNWDLKDVNNSIYAVKGDRAEQRYMVSDVGASLGANAFNYGLRGNLKAYSRSKWIGGTSPEYVDFAIANWSAFNHWITRRIPVEDARWIGNLLAKLSPDQIRDAFLAAGYSPQDAEGFAQVVQRRIADLRKL